MIKADIISEIVVSRYKGLFVENIWSLVKEVARLYIHILNYSDNQLSDRRFMYAILVTLGDKVLTKIIDNTRE